MAEKTPPSLRPVQPFLAVAKQFQKRDPVVSYYAKVYAVQEGLALGRNDPEAKTYLLGAMDDLEQMKQKLKKLQEEAMTSDVVAQVHIEEVALRLFEFADGQDRAAKFDRNMIKAFFTASQIFTILKQFGDLSEEIESKMKYAKWKAVEIDRCLKSGVPPTPGPPGGNEDDLELQFGGMGPPAAVGSSPSEEGLSDTHSPSPKPVPRPRQNIPRPTPQGADMISSLGNLQSGEGGASYLPPVAPSVSLGPSEIAKAQKLCKFASSALDYEDIQGAIDYLGKAMNLLTRGKED